MQDRQIVSLLLARDQRGMEQMQQKYGNELLLLTHNLLRNLLDAEECVNDALLTAWRRIPPEQPEPLWPWLYTVARNLALNRYRKNHAQKRDQSLCDAFEELKEVFLEPGRTEEIVEQKELAKKIDRFLSRLPRLDRMLFMGRYYAGASFAELSARCGLSIGACKMRLMRLRKKLRSFLEKEGLLS